MNALKLLLLTLFMIIPISNGSGGGDKSSSSIEGLWITTEETSSRFLSGTQKILLRIHTDSNKKWTVRGVFLWNGDYQSEWKLVNMHYDTISHRITILDEDSDTLKCIMDAKNDRLIGAVYLQSKTKNSLNFLRASNNLESRLFHPRLPDIHGNIYCGYNNPEQLDDGIETTSIYDENIDTLSVIKLIKDIINQKYGRMESILILKDNKLILEEYFYGYHRAHLHKIYSCTKSITSLLFGMVLERNKQIDLNQSIFSFFSEYDSLKTSAKERITLKHILTMTSGLQWHEYPKEMYELSDRIKYVLSRPIEAKPGKKFLYNSGGSIVIGGVITSFVGKQVKAFADKFLFGPLGITNYVWKTYKNGDLEYWNGLQLLPRDMAKIGLLVLNDGRWQNKQIVSKEWIRESTRPHVRESDYFNYGYQWWHRSQHNHQWWKEPHSASSEEHDMVIALAWGGQYIMVIKDLNLVVVTTASDYDDGNKARSKFPMVIEEIVPIFEDARL